MNILLFLLLGATQGKLGPISYGSVNIRLTILPPPPTEQQIMSTESGGIITQSGRSYVVIRNESSILIEPL